MNSSYAQYLIEKTKEDFDKIADEFSRSRSQLWPEQKELKVYIRKGDRILDLGCGNGRLFDLFRIMGIQDEIDYTGIDGSEKSISIAKQRYGEKFQVADILSLPFPDNYFDSVWPIATFHHIPSKALRVKALIETKRVLKPGGKVIMTCWNLYQPQYLKLLLKFALGKIFGKNKLDFKDVFVPWGEIKIQRYYHAFTRRELKKLFQKAGFKVEELKYLKRNGKKTNILIVAVKP